MSAASEADKRAAQLDAYIEERDAATHRQGDRMNDALKEALTSAQAYINWVEERNPQNVAPADLLRVKWVKQLAAAARDTEAAVAAERKRWKTLLIAYEEKIRANVGRFEGAEDKLHQFYTILDAAADMLRDIRNGVEAAQLIGGEE